MQSVLKLSEPEITVSSTAGTLEEFITAAAGADFSFNKNNMPDAVDVQVLTGAMRYFADGNAPTTSKGFLLNSAGVAIKQFRGEELNRIKLIRDGAVDATVVVQVGYTVR